MEGAKPKLKAYLLSRVGEDIDRETLREVAGGIHDWQRSIRQLRQETGLDIVATENGYILTDAAPVRPPMLRKAINDKLRYAVLQRDNSVCQRCGRGISDGVKLVVDHKIPVDMGGETTIDNLWTLCDNCNGGKKSFFSDDDAALMREIGAMKSGYARLKRYFECNPDRLIPPTKLQAVGKVRDWERVVRQIRADEGMRLEYIIPTKAEPMGGYIYRTK